MATLGPYDYSSPSTRFQGDAVVESQSGNHSHIRITISCWNGPSGNSSSQYNGAGTHKAAIANVAWVVEHCRQNPGCPVGSFLPADGGANTLRWSDVGYIDIEHNLDGTHADVNLQMQIKYGSIDTGELYAALSLPRIPKVPPATTSVDVINPATTSLTYRYNGAADNGGSAIIRWESQHSTTSDFSSGNGTVQTGTGTDVHSSLVPGTTYYFRSRGVNAVGDGAWSNIISGLTLPAVPPGFVVASSPSGTQAILTFSPPGGVTGVTKYTYEQRPTLPPQTPVTSTDSATTTATALNLTPGTSYDWRASAWIGTYQSPWTGWTTLVQAKPNVNPGDYFDGASVDVADLDYAWTGTANASTSTATAVGADGWEFTTVAGAAAVMYRVTAGLFGAYAARTAFTADATTAGCRFGMKNAAAYWADVIPGATYVGSIHVKPSRSQNMQAEIVWLTAAGAVITQPLGTASVVAANTWTRLSVTAVAPATAEWAIVRALDVTGTGWSTFKGGDIVDVDGAMVTLQELFPYFDGDTLFDGTFVYEWLGVANKSTSSRTPADSAGGVAGALGVGTFAVGPSLLAGPLLDPNCVPPAPPRPPTIPSDCITEAGVWRRTIAAIPAVQVSDYLDVVPTFTITTISKSLSQVRIRIYPNPNAIPIAVFDTTTGWISEQIISYLPKSTVLTIDGIHQRVYAEVAGSEPIAADHLLYGSQGSPATWPVLSCGMNYVVAADLPVDVDQADSKLLTYLTTRY